MAETTLVTLPDGPGVFDVANLNAVNAAFTAQNLNNTSLRAAITVNAAAIALAATFPVPSSQIDPAVIQYKTVAIANAAVKTLFGTGTALVAAQGAGTLIEILSLLLENVYLTAAFTAGGAIQASYGAGVTIPASATVASTFLTSPAASQSILVAGALASNLSSAVLNTAVNLACATQEFATGAGSLIVKVAYRVHTGL